MSYTVEEVRKYAQATAGTFPRHPKKKKNPFKVPGSIFNALDGGESFDDDFSLASLDDVGYTTSLATAVKAAYFDSYSYEFGTYPDIYFDDNKVRAQAIFKNCILKLSKQFNTVGELLQYIEFTVLNWDLIENALKFKGFPTLQFISHESVVNKIRGYQRYGLPDKKVKTATRDRAGDSWDENDMEF
jgi:hypothetical protein